MEGETAEHMAGVSWSSAKEPRSTGDAKFNKTPVQLEFFQKLTVQKVGSVRTMPTVGQFCSFLGIGSQPGYRVLTHTQIFWVSFGISQSTLLSTPKPKVFPCFSLQAAIVLE